MPDLILWEAEADYQHLISKKKGEQNSLVSFSLEEMLVAGSPQWSRCWLT